MFNSYVQEQRAQAARHQSPRTVQEGKQRTELALKYKQRLDQELVKVQLIQLALHLPVPGRNTHTPTAKLLGEAKFRVQGCRTTLERLAESAQARDLLDTSASHAPAFLLRPRQKDLEIGTALRFKSRTQTERLAETIQSRLPSNSAETSMRTQSAGRGLLPEYHQKTYEKTILSVGMNLHTWLQGKKHTGPREQTLKEQVKQEKSGQIAIQPRRDKPLLCKQPFNTSLSLLDNLRSATSAHNFVLTYEQKMRITEEIIRKKDWRRGKLGSPLRSQRDSSPNTYYNGFVRKASLSVGRKRESRAC